MSKVFVVGVILVTSAVAMPAAQSLGELAKKTAAERAAKEKDAAAPATKTYTNKDLDKIGGAGGSAAPPMVDVPPPADVVAKAPKGVIDQAKFEGVYRAAKAIQGATASGVSYITFRQLLQGLTTELSIARDHGPFSERETALEGLFAAALRHYEISADFWKLKIDSSDAMWKGEIPIQIDDPRKPSDPSLVMLAGLYGIPVHDRFYSPPMPASAFRYKAVDADAMQRVWTKASETVDAAAALYVAK